jgi:hypothetical protein
MVKCLVSLLNHLFSQASADHKVIHWTSGLWAGAGPQTVV